MKTKLLFLLFLAALTTYSQTNLVPNGGFENWSSSSQPDNWYRYFSGFASQSNTAQNGTSSTNMMIVDGTYNYINSEYFPVEANKTYRITLYHKLVSGSFSAIDFSLYHKPGTFKEEIIKKTDATFSSTEWRKIEFDYTPTATENIEVDILTTGTLNSEILVDNVSVIDVAELNQVYTLIPDENFEKELIKLGIDSGTPDGKVLTNKINKLTSLKVSTSSIADLTGIEDFTALVTLDCSVFNSYSSSGGGTGKLTKLDVTKNKLLESLTCSGNKLTSLNVSENKLLKWLSFDSNILTEIDLSNNTALTYLNCYYNRLTNLDVTKNPLNYLKCSSNNLTNLDLTNNSGISTLDCSMNQITSLDISKLSLLESLDVSRNKINKLDIADKTKLISVNCFSNSITSLDVSQLTDLQVLSCSSNLLTSLDVTHNTKLTGLSCGTNTISSFDITKNLMLIDLECSSLQLNELDVTKHTALKKLAAGANNLASINLSNNVLLTDISLPKNQLTDIDITKNVLLKSLNVSENKLTVLNPVNNTALQDISCDNNLLTSLDISNNKKVTYVNCNNNKLTNLNLKNGFASLYINLTLPNYKNNPDLKCIQVTDALYAKTNWSYYADPNVRFSEDCAAPLELSSNNFAVESKGEFCLGSNNGEINITATAAYDYEANINGKSYSFTNNNLKVSSLAPGIYKVSITIPGENFEQNFAITIPKGTTITGKSSVTHNKVSVEISEGTAPYTVLVDGVEQFETTDSNFSVLTKKGGLLEVKTAKACEGIYAQDLAGLEGAISAYPNPTSGTFAIEIPTMRREVKISLYALDGHLISNKTYTVENGNAQLSLEKEASGVYFAKIELDTPNYLKIIKN